MASRTSGAWFVVVALLLAACDAGGDGSAPERRVGDGGILRIAGASDVDSMDPAVMYTSTSWTLARGVLRTLVTYPAVPDLEQQNVLVPDLATGTGETNSDATRWDFVIRDDVSYGPALGGETIPGVTGEEVACDDFAYAFERLFIDSVDPGYAYYFDIIEGTEEFEAGLSDGISGIRCDGDQKLSFVLSEPAGDWPYRLTLPATAPVPRGAAEPYDEGSSSSYGEHLVGTGPYYVAAWERDETIHLSRSPQWDRASDGVREANVSEVQWSLGLSHDEAIEGVLSGDYDYSLDIAPGGKLLEDILNDDALSRRLLRRPDFCTRYIFMNTTVAPFDDVRVRHAVNWVIDRSSLKRIQGGPLTGELATSILPPGITGHLPPEDYNPFETTDMAGDASRGRALMAQAGYPDGYDEPVLVVGMSDDPHDDYFDSVVADLAEIGFTRIRRKLVPYPRHYTRYYGVPDRDVAMGVSAGWCKDYNDAFTFFDPLFHGDSIAPANNQNYAQLDDPELNDLIDLAAATPVGAERTRAWEAVNRKATELAAWVPWSWDSDLIFYGENVVDPVFLSFISHIDWTVVSLRADEEP